MIERLRPDHAAAVLAFEQENRAYFATSISERGDDYFTEYQQRHDDALAEQAAGVCLYHVVTDNDGEVLGRVNLYNVANGSADLGFRIAKKAAGRGLATSAVRQMCAMAAQDYKLSSLRASAATNNLGSRTVLNRAGFIETGEQVQLAGRPGLRYLLQLANRG